MIALICRLLIAIARLLRPRRDPVGDYLDAMHGLRSGGETVIDPARPGHVQAFRDHARDQQRGET